MTGWPISLNLYLITISQLVKQIQGDKSVPAIKKKKKAAAACPESSDICDIVFLKVQPNGHPNHYTGEEY